MPHTLLALVILIAALPFRAGACEASFRAGMAGSAAYTRLLRTTQAELFGATDWISGPEVLARLERRSARTSGCQELALHRAQLGGAQALLGGATRQFQQARALCFGPNRERADQNLGALQRAETAYLDLMDFIERVWATCRPQAP